jgi:hypothetical protein
MRFGAILTAVLLLVVCAAPARAQQAIKLEFNNGRVSLNAQNAPLRAILAEWARLGGATIVGGDRVAGAPVTLELVAVPERQALDTLLRTVAAYLLAPRRAGSVGASTVDRILILPTSTAPRNPAPAPAANALPGPPRPAFPRPPVIMNPGEPDVDDNDPDSPADLVAQPRVVRPPQTLPGGAGGIMVPVPVPEPDGADNEPVVIGGSAPTAGNPFGVPAGSSARPGVIAPVQQPQTPNQNQRQQP